MRNHFIIIFLSILHLLIAENRYRLPTNVVPSLYTITLHPDLDKETFKGKVSIHVKVKSFTESIVLHSSGLNITSLYLNAELVGHISAALNSTYFYDFCDYELLEIQRNDKRKMSPGNYLINIKYSGKFSNNETGLIKAKFTENNTVRSYLLVTDFEPFHARRTFPCFDEPAFKAKFQLNLVAPNSSYHALSNTKVLQSYTTSYGHVYKFETTPLMSTYILAFAITQYNYNEFIWKCGNIPVRAYSYKLNDTSTKNVMKYAAQALDFYSKYTNFRYPLPKVDLIEYDRKLSVATENWGLITFKTGVISDSDDFYDLQRLNVIVHEIAHYWFGNLVTNDWWDDLWLQEGFAVFVALKAEEQIKHNNASVKFPNQLMEDAIYWFDQQKESKPIVYFSETLSDINMTFNDIVYIKGAALLAMIEVILGEKKFQKAVQCYISRYAYKTATTSDFIEIIEKFKPENADIRGFMETYLYQNRYPVIYVTEKDNHYVLNQSSCSDYRNEVDSPYEYKWTIPIYYVTSENHNKPNLVWFDKDMEILKIRKKNEKWINFNYQEKGIYRVIYSDNMWNNFINYANEMDIRVKSYLFLQATQLFDADIISCNVGLQYFKSLFENDSRNFSIDYEYSFVAYQKLKKIREYDQNAYQCLKNFYVHVLTKTRGKKAAQGIKNSDEEEQQPSDNEAENKMKNSNKRPSEKMLSCIKWLKENLSDYC